MNIYRSARTLTVSILFSVAAPAQAADGAGPAGNPQALRDELTKLREAFDHATKSQQSPGAAELDTGLKVPPAFRAKKWVGKEIKLAVGELKLHPTGKQISIHPANGLPMNIEVTSLAEFVSSEDGATPAAAAFRTAVDLRGTVAFFVEEDNRRQLYKLAIRRDIASEVPDPDPEPAPITKPPLPPRPPKKPGEKTGTLVTPMKSGAGTGK